MVKAIKCPYCKRIFIDADNQGCPFCKAILKDDFNLLKDLFGTDNPFDDALNGDTE